MKSLLLIDMGKTRVYVETTIPSFYHEVRTAPDIVARRDWTRQWWADAVEHHELVTSVAVLDELENGPPEYHANWLGLVNGLPLLAINRAVAEIAAAYIQHRLMPASSTGDALHLALASHHKCDFLVTWNCRHLANANKFGHIRRINSMLGLYVPALVTPLELLGDSDDSENQ